MFLKTIYSENKKLLLLFLHFCFSLFLNLDKAKEGVLLLSPAL